MESRDSRSAADAPKPVQPAPAPEPLPSVLAPDEARRARYWLTWHVRSGVLLTMVSATVLALVSADYDGPLWPIAGLSLIATTLAFVGTMALASRLADGIARGAGLGGAGLIGATCAGYIYLVTVGTLDLELGEVPLHTLGLLLLGGLVSLGVYAGAVQRLTEVDDRRFVLATMAVASALGILVGAELLDVLPTVPLLPYLLLVPLALHVASMESARRALRAFARSSALEE